jgi:hypothetical protein
MIVILHPDLSLFPYLNYVFKDEFIRYPVAVAAIESFNVCILGMLAGLYEFKL